eukprot:9487986-Pyramimonas_sp.AAC.1
MTTISKRWAKREPRSAHAGRHPAPQRRLLNLKKASWLKTLNQRSDTARAPRGSIPLRHSHECSTGTAPD